MEQEYRYMVCTSCMTYNHAPYIVDAMNGFTMQETTFPVYYLITDDASTDGEPEVIKQYLAEYFQAPYRTEETDDYLLMCANHNTNPNCIFIVFFLKYNHYSIKKSKLPYQSEWRDNTKYIAICEGDDYWIHPKKIQMQVDFMEKHQETGVVYSKAKIYYQERMCFHGVCGEESKGFDQTLVKNPIVNLTSCYRASLSQKYQIESNGWDTSGWKMGDYPMWIWMAKHCDFHFLKMITGVYRVLSESASHSQNLQKTLNFLENNYQVQIFFADKYKVAKNVKRQIFDEYVISRILTLCHNRCYREAFSELSSINIKNRILYIFKIISLLF